MLGVGAAEWLQDKGDHNALGMSISRFNLSDLEASLLSSNGLAISVLTAIAALNTLIWQEF